MVYIQNYKHKGIVQSSSVVPGPFNIFFSDLVKILCVSS